MNAIKTAAMTSAASPKNVAQEGYRYMKKFACMVCFVLLPAAAFAQEKTLYDIGQDMFALVEACAACAEPDSACTGDDAAALQAGAEGSLRELAWLIRSGTFKNMMLSENQVRALSERAQAVQAQLMHSEFFDALCNWAILFRMYIFSFIVLLLRALLFLFGWAAWGQLLIVVLAIPIVTFGLALALGSIILLVPCLFWWL